MVSLQGFFSVYHYNFCHIQVSYIEYSIFFLSFLFRSCTLNILFYFIFIFFIQVSYIEYSTTGPVICRWLTMMMMMAMVMTMMMMIMMMMMMKMTRIMTMNFALFISCHVMRQMSDGRASSAIRQITQIITDYPKHDFSASDKSFPKNLLICVKKI